MRPIGAVTLGILAPGERDGAAHHRTAVPATDARCESRQALETEPWYTRDPAPSFGMMKDRNLAGTVSLGAAVPDAGGVVLDPGRPRDDLTVISGCGDRRVRPGGQHCEQRLGKGPARPPGPATSQDAHRRRHSTPQDLPRILGGSIRPLLVMRLMDG